MGRVVTDMTQDGYAREGHAGDTKVTRWGDGTVHATIREGHRTGGEVTHRLTDLYIWPNGHKSGVSMLYDERANETMTEVMSDYEIDTAVGMLRLTAM